MTEPFAQAGFDVRERRFEGRAALPVGIADIALGGVQQPVDTAAREGVARKQRLALAKRHDEDEIVTTQQCGTRRARHVTRHVDAARPHQFDGLRVRRLAGQRMRARGSHLDPRQRLSEQRRRQRAAADVSLTDHQHGADHFAITPAVSPELISGISRVRTRLKRTRPLPST